MKKSQLKQLIKEMIISELTMVGSKTDPSEAPSIARTERTGLDTVKDAISQARKTQTSIGVAEISLNEMAKITGDLDAAIRAVVQDNPDLEGLPLKKAIKGNKEVIDALDGDELYDNQLNKFIALIKGQRQLGQRGRKPLETKKEEPKEPKTSTYKAPASKEKSSEKEKDEQAQTSAKTNKSSVRLQKLEDELVAVEKEMKEIVGKYKQAEGEEKEKLKDALKEKTKAKKELEKAQDRLISLLK